MDILDLRRSSAQRLLMWSFTEIDGNSPRPRKLIDGVPGSNLACSSLFALRRYNKKMIRQKIRRDATTMIAAMSGVLYPLFIEGLPVVSTKNKTSD